MTLTIRPGSGALNSLQRGAVEALNEIVAFGDSKALNERSNELAEFELTEAKLVPAMILEKYSARTS